MGSPVEAGCRGKAPAPATMDRDFPGLPVALHQLPLVTNCGAGHRAVSASGLSGSPAADPLIPTVGSLSGTSLLFLMHEHRIPFRSRFLVSCCSPCRSDPFSFTSRIVFFLSPGTYVCPVLSLLLFWRPVIAGSVSPPPVPQRGSGDSYSSPSSFGKRFDKDRGCLRNGATQRLAPSPNGGWFPAGRVRSQTGHHQQALPRLGTDVPCC
ncbi:hypothetical protein GE09DRAFT_7522 [Coniochaeta sp. 2T2.1]|nr:hypothetical protein GE09DRAFT_7522 [Coniochaeta sp. 2T2.1]